MHHSRLCAVLIDCKTSDVDEAARFWGEALEHFPIDVESTPVIRQFRLKQLQGADLYQAHLQGAELRQAGLQGADLRETRLWHLRGDDAAWDFTDLRASSVREMTNSQIDALISETTKGISGTDRRQARTEKLNALLRTEDSPGSGLPELWRSEPNVMFGLSDPAPEGFAWGPRKWETEQAYDEDLAKFVGDLACGRDVPEAQTRGLARRALTTAGDEPGRVWPALFAARVIGPDCPPAMELPADFRRPLEELAAQGDPAVAPPQASPPAPIE